MDGKASGGKLPQKFDSTITAYCKSGVPVPPYVQHTGGDEGLPVNLYPEDGANAMHHLLRS